MKRSGFKPRTKPMNRGTSTLAGALRRSSFKPFAGKSPSPKKKALRTNRKPLSASDDRYFRAVAALPCACCGVWGLSQVAHSNQAKYGKGMGMKADNRFVFPLCCDRLGAIGCHTMHDQCIGMTREEANAREEIYLADTKAKLGVGQ
jgi:hypothetical protein